MRKFQELSRAKKPRAQCSVYVSLAIYFRISDSRGQRPTYSPPRCRKQNASRSAKYQPPIKQKSHVRDSGEHPSSPYHTIHFFDSSVLREEWLMVPG